MTARRTYAIDTTVPISRTRGEIVDLLRQWGCTQIGWSDDYEARTALLRFAWPHEGTTYSARMSIQTPSDEEIRAEFRRFASPTQIDNRMRQRERALHRLLLLKIKGDLHAVQAGLLTAVEAFLPMLETSDGRTLAAALVPRLEAQRSADRLLE